MSQVLSNHYNLTSQLTTLIRECTENNIQAQEQLYRYCYPDMIRICFRYAGDMDGAGIIFNNAMLKVFRHIGSYQEEGRLLGWVNTIVVNCCIDYVKKQNRFKEIKAAMPREEILIPPEALQTISAREIQELIAALPKATATVFNLFIYEGYTHRQIAQALRISEGTSKWHVNEARRVLKEKLKSLINTRNL